MPLPNYPLILDILTITVVLSQRCDTAISTDQLFVEPSCVITKCDNNSRRHTQYFFFYSTEGYKKNTLADDSQEP